MRARVEVICRASGEATASLLNAGRSEPAAKIRSGPVTDGFYPVGNRSSDWAVVATASRMSSRAAVAASRGSAVFG